MSKRKADFDTPEKENKRPKTSGSGTPSAGFSKMSGKFGNSWLRYDPKSKLKFCDYCIKSQRQNIFTKALKEAVLLKIMYSNMVSRKVKFGKMLWLKKKNKMKKISAFIIIVYQILTTRHIYRTLGWM